MNGFGDKWSCNWLGTLQSQAGSDTITDHRGGGGQEVFGTNGVASSMSARWFVPTGGGGGGGGDGGALITWTGSENVYGNASGDMTGNTNYFLSQRADRYGRVLQQFNYQTIGTFVRMTNMIDMDGRTNTLTYGNSTFSNLITAVTDPYGHTAYFNYDGSGLLTNIVDAQGMSTFSNTTAVRTLPTW